MREAASIAPVLTERQTTIVELIAAGYTIIVDDLEQHGEFLNLPGIGGERMKLFAGARKEPVAMAFAAVAAVGAVWLIALVVTGQRIQALPLEILLLGCGLVIGYNVGRRRPGN